MCTNEDQTSRLNTFKKITQACKVAINGFVEIENTIQNHLNTINNFSEITFNKIKSVE